MAAFGQPLPLLQPWSSTSPYQYWTGAQIEYDVLPYSVPVKPCRAEFRHGHLGPVIYSGGHGTLEYFGNSAPQDARLVEAALCEAAEIFRTVQGLMQSHDVYARKLQQRFFGSQGSTLIKSSLDKLLQPQRFIVEPRRHQPDQLVEREMSPPDQVTWVQFFENKPYKGDFFATAWCDANKRVLTYCIDVPAFSQKLAALSDMHIAAGQDVTELMNTVTPVTIQQLARLILSDIQIDPDSFMAFAVLSYLQAKHFMLDFISHRQGIVRAKEFNQMWSPVAQEYRLAHNGRDPPIDNEYDSSAVGGQFTTQISLLPPLTFDGSTFRSSPSSPPLTFNNPFDLTRQIPFSAADNPWSRSRPQFLFPDRFGSMSISRYHSLSLSLPEDPGDDRDQALSLSQFESVSPFDDQVLAQSRSKSEVRFRPTREAEREQEDWWQRLRPIELGEGHNGPP